MTRVIGRPFLPGQSGNPRGRRKGSRHKLSEAFLADLAEDWDANGIEAPRRLRTSISRARACSDGRRARTQDPAAYVRVVASLLPKQTEKLANPLADLTDDELDKLDAFLATIRGPMMRSELMLEGFQPTQDLAAIDRRVSRISKQNGLRLDF